MQNSPNPGRQLLTVNATVGLTAIPDDRYGSIVQEYGPVDDRVTLKLAREPGCKSVFLGEIPEK